MKWLENNVHETDAKITQWKSDRIYHPIKINQQEDHDVSAFDKQLNDIMIKKLEKLQDPILDTLASGDFDYKFILTNRDFIAKNYANKNAITNIMAAHINRVIWERLLQALYDASGSDSLEIKLGAEFMININTDWSMTVNADQFSAIGSHMILWKIDIFDLTKNSVAKYLFKSWDHVQVEPIIMPSIWWYIDNYNPVSGTFQLFSSQPIRIRRKIFIKAINLR